MLEKKCFSHCLYNGKGKQVVAPQQNHAGGCCIQDLQCNTEEMARFSCVTYGIAVCGFLS